MQKKLIINPTKDEQSSIVLLNPNSMKTDLVEKVMKTTTSSFRKTLFSPTNLGLLIGNVEPKVVGASSYVDVELESFDEAIDYVEKVARDIYGPEWSLKLIKNEVMYNRAESFGVRIDDEETVQKVQDMLKYVADVQVREVRKPKNKQKKEELTKEDNDEQSNEQ